MTDFLETPIGVLRITAEGGFITGVEHICGEAGAFEAEKPAAGAGAKGGEDSSADAEALSRCARELAEYFSGTRAEFTVPALAHGTEYRKRVWRELRGVSYGEVISYKELAIRVGDPNASRAVGGANRANPLMIIVPCHRVIGSGGSLTGYGGGGIKNKEWLLNHEKANRDRFALTKGGV